MAFMLLGLNLTGCRSKNRNLEVIITGSKGTSCNLEFSRIISKAQ